jgi:hypothetical protein
LLLQPSPKRAGVTTRVIDDRTPQEHIGQTVRTSVGARLLDASSTRSQARSGWPSCNSAKDAKQKATIPGSRQIPKTIKPFDILYVIGVFEYAACFPYRRPDLVRK